MTTMSSPNAALPASPPTADTQSLRVTILYEDEALIVVRKPSGLLSVPGRGEDKADCVAARMQAHDSQAKVVHRLDMSTSGLMLFARGAQMQGVISQLFERRRIDKRYTAVVAGTPDRTAGEIDLPLCVDWPNRPRQKIDPVEGRPALTRWAVREAGPLPDTTRVDLQPVTGRSHQLRVHLWALGHPIVGDDLYAPPDVRALAPRLWLHACRVVFNHPLSGRKMVFDDPAPF